MASECPAVSALSQIVDSHQAMAADHAQVGDDLRAVAAQVARLRQLLATLMAAGAGISPFPSDDADHDGASADDLDRQSSSVYVGTGDTPTKVVSPSKQAKPRESAIMDAAGQAVTVPEVGPLAGSSGAIRKQVDGISDAMADVLVLASLEPALPRALVDAGASVLASDNGRADPSAEDRVSYVESVFDCNDVKVTTASLTTVRPTAPSLGSRPEANREALRSNATSAASPAPRNTVQQGRAAPIPATLADITPEDSPAKAAREENNAPRRASSAAPQTPLRQRSGDWAGEDSPRSANTFYFAGCDVSVADLRIVAIREYLASPRKKPDLTASTSSQRSAGNQRSPAGTSVRTTAAKRPTGKQPHAALSRVAADGASTDTFEVGDTIVDFCGVAVATRAELAIAASLTSPLLMRELCVRVHRAGEKRNTTRAVFVSAVPASAAPSASSASSAPSSPHARRLYSLSTAASRSNSDAMAAGSGDFGSHSPLQVPAHSRPELEYLQPFVGLATEPLLAALFLPPPMALIDTPHSPTASSTA